MNEVILMGRLTRDPEIRYTEMGKCIARYTLAVDRRGKEQAADFITCVAFEKNAEFAEKYLKKGTKIAVTGRLRTGSYEKDDGTKVYTTDVIVSTHEFAESKKDGGRDRMDDAMAAQYGAPDEKGFQELEGVDEELPFT